MKAKILFLVAALMFSVYEANSQKWLEKISKAVDKALDTADKALDAVSVGEASASEAQPAPQSAEQAPSAAPQTQPADNLITATGAGPFKFGTVKAGTTGAYNVRLITEDYEMGVDYLVVENADGGWAVRYFPDDMMEVYTPAFQLENGIKVGMTLAEVQQKMGAVWKPVPDQFDQMRQWVFEYSKNIGLVFSDLKDGGKAFDAAWAKGTEYRPTVDSFKTTAPVDQIIIRK